MVHAGKTLGPLDKFGETSYCHLERSVADAKSKGPDMARHSPLRYIPAVRNQRYLPAIRSDSQFIRSHGFTPARPSGFPDCAFGSARNDRDEQQRKSCIVNRAFR